MTKFLYFLCAFLLFPLNAQALESPWASADQVRARLLSAVDNPGPDKSFEGALEIKLSDGWHTYWKMPGDAGLAARLDWSKSQNIDAVEAFWPAPKRKQELDFQVFGYDKDFTVPLLYTLQESGKAATLALQLNIMVCNEICIPQSLDLTLDIPAGEGDSAKISRHTRSIEFAKQKIPSTDNTGALTIKTAVLGPEALVISVSSSTGFKDTEALAYSDTVYFTSPPEIVEDETDARKILVRLKKPEDVEDLNEALSGQTLHIYLFDGRNALEHEIAF